VWTIGILGFPLAMWWARKKLRGTFRLVVSPMLWFLAAVLSVVATGKFYDHHLLQTLPPLVLLAATVIVMALRHRKPVVRALAVVVLVCTVAVQAIGAARNLRREMSRPDIPREVGRYLAERINPGDTIYVANSQPIVYLLCGATPPSRFVLPAWIIRPELRQRLGVDLETFLNGVFEQRPSFVVMEQDHPWLPDRGFVDLLVEDHLVGNYEPDARFGSTLVFRETGSEL